MEGRIIVLLIIVLIVILMVYLFQDSNLLKELKSVQENILDKLNDVKESREIELADRPIIYYRLENEGNYRPVSVNRKKFKIGRGKNNDLIFKSKTTEEKHVVIYKQYKNSRVYFELVNYGKVNPVEYYNKEKERYEYLGYKEGVELDGRDAFYIGSTKIIMVVPIFIHKPTDTERIGRDVINGGNRKNNSKCLTKKCQ